MPTPRSLAFLATLAAMAALAAPAQAQFQSCNYCDVTAFSPDPLPVNRCDTGTLNLRGIGYQSTAVNGCSQTPETVVRSTRPDRLTVIAYRIRNDGRIDVDYQVPCNASPGIVGLDVTIDDDPADAIVPYACGNARLIVVPVCGDGSVDPGEQCDDGNTVAGDGCDENCRLETLAVSFTAFTAVPTPAGVRIAWETTEERGTSFFEVRARLGDGSERVALPAVEAGAYRYEALDRSPEARAGRVSAYRVQEWTDSGPGDSTPWFSPAPAPAPVSTGAAGSRSR